MKHVAFIAALLWSAAASAQMALTGVSAPLIGYGPGDVASFSRWCGMHAYSRATVGTASLRLVRASDSTQQDVNTLANGKFDAASATTFCAATTCKVVTCYDKTAGASNYTQATDANRPAYVADCGDGVPCFQGSAAGTQLASASVTPATGVVSLVTEAQRTAGTGLCSGYRENLQNNRIAANATLNQWRLIGGTSGQITPTAAENVFHAFAGRINGASSAFVVDSTLTTGTVTGNTTAGAALVLVAVPSTTCAARTGGHVDNVALTDTQLQAINGISKGYR